MKLRGTFESDDFQGEYNFGVPESTEIHTRRDAVEGFVVKGGDMPNLEDLPDYPWEHDDHLPPGLPESHDRAEDDPANRCVWDEVDEII